MKKLAVILVAAGMLATFSGCHLRHDMLPATCTEPSTCSICGKTEGEPLGHTEVPDEAVEPTCTETGLTAGSHCEVCGEVLTPQETIEALGHDWEDATFSEPKTCRVCGETEGEALGNELFINALNPPLPEEEMAETAEKILEEAAGETADEDADTAADDLSIHKDIRISGLSHGLGEADAFFDSSSFEMTADAEDGQYRFLAETVVNGSRPIPVLVAADREGIGFTMPGVTHDYYYISFETLTELLGLSAQTSAQPDAGVSSPQEAVAKLEELFASEEIRDLLLKYERILFSVVTVHNAKETRMEFPLSALDKKQDCLVLEIRPDVSDWRVMLRKLLTTAAADEDLKEKLIRPLAELMYTYDDSAAWRYDSPEEYADEMLKAFDESVESALGDVNEIAETLAELTFTAAYDSGRLYALHVLDTTGEGLCYESYGAPDTEREDILTVNTGGEENRLVYNSFQVSGSHLTGRLAVNDEELTLDYDLGTEEDGRPFFDIRLGSSEYTAALSLENEEAAQRLKALFDTAEADAQVEAVVSDTEERVTVPDEKKVLKTEEDVAEAFETVSEEIRQAELFGHSWKEATCTEPRTCEVCGETEGEPLGHDWGPLTEAGERVCSRCGETETVFEPGELAFTDDGEGTSRLVLSEEQKEAIDEIALIVLQDTEHGYLHLGRLQIDESLIGEESALPAALDPEWFCINGTPAVYLESDEDSAGSGGRTHQGVVPFMCNDEVYFLQVSESDGTVTADNIMDADEKPVDSLKDSDKIQLLGEYFTPSLSSRGVDTVGEELTLRDARNISLQPWPDREKIIAFYMLEDKEGYYRYSENFYP